MPLTLHVRNLEKRFGTRRVLRGLTFEAVPGEVIGVQGPNGSGKSTLLQVLAGLQRPTSGIVVYRDGPGELTPVEAGRRIGFVSPALSLYDELSAAENMAFFAAFRGIRADVPPLLERVGLSPRRREPVRAYSSGMRQRLKLAWALMHDPEVLFLDEPGTNLDDEGRALVASLVEERRHAGWILLASNDPDELSLATRHITLAAAGAGAAP